MTFRSTAAVILSTLALAACSDGPIGPESQQAAGAAAAVIEPAEFCDGGAIPAGECEALVALYNGTGGAAWTDAAGWGVDANPCNWFGVTCNGTPAHVTSLILTNNGLAGMIPAEIAGLTELGVLFLQQNALTGGIPASIGTMSQLANLQLWNNDLTGGIPVEFGNLTNLLNLTLTGNQLTGGIPAELANSPGLRSLRLGDNAFTGSIPEELGTLTDMELLVLGDNQLTGEIPASLGNLTKLMNLLLHDNDLSGTVPLGVAVLGDPMLACALTGNAGLVLPDLPAYRNADTDVDGQICGLDFTPVADATPEALLEAIAALVPAPLNHGQANALGRKVQQAASKAAQGQYGVAVAVMNAFVAQVQDFEADGILDAAQAAALIDPAQQLIAEWEAML